MDTRGPWWAALIVWGVVNAVNVLQSAGFLSRVRTHSMSANHAIGYAIVLLAVPATVALAAYVRADAGWRLLIGPAVFDAFVLFMLVVDYVHPIEFRSPALPPILVPYLVLFFGSILLMGLPMFRMDLRLWAITALTTAMLLASMGFAMARGVA